LHTHAFDIASAQLAVTARTQQQLSKHCCNISNLSELRDVMVIAGRAHVGKNNMQEMHSTVYQTHPKHGAICQL
jgi:hypothetical protein